MRMRVDESNGGCEGCSNHDGVRESAASGIREELRLGLVLVNLICFFQLHTTKGREDLLDVLEAFEPAN